jgi:hypothetical protein
MLGVYPLRLRRTEQTIAIRIQPPKILRRSEELVTGYIPVAVSVHLAKPDGAGAGKVLMADGDHDVAAVRGETCLAKTDANA